MNSDIYENRKDIKSTRKFRVSSREVNGTIEIGKLWLQKND